MITMDQSTLNPLEKKIHEILLRQKDVADTLRINQAAQLCDCSVSKISKFVKKVGFHNYKQYMGFLAGKNPVHAVQTNELQRVSNFLAQFDTTLVDDLYTLIQNHRKIVLFGYGPSLLCAQYFEYRFRNCSDKTTMAVSDPVAVINMVDETSLLIIITETGRFHSFQDVYNASKAKGCDVVIVVEEYNTELLTQCDKIFWLSTFQQPTHLKAYEKSRTLFFIFLEEIVQRFLAQKEGSHA
jgi:DNA-binding MurR/RpiR family transcriptional regulator